MITEESLKIQLTEVEKVYNDIKKSDQKVLEEKIQIIRSFIISKIFPKEFNDSQKEDLRRLTKEIEYDYFLGFKYWLGKFRKTLN